MKRDRRVPSRLKSLAPLATAILAWLAFPGVGLSPLALIAWAPLIASLHDATPREGFFRGWLAGAAMNALGGSFLYAVLLRESGLPAPLAAAVFILFAGYQGLSTALAAWLAARAGARGWSVGLAFTLAAAGLEAAFPMPFHWSFGASVGGWRWLVQAADLGGVTLVSGVLFAVNASVASLLSTTAARERSAGRYLRSLPGIAVLGASLVYGAARVRSVEDAMRAAPTARFGVVHTTRRAHDAADLPRLLARIQDAGARGAELVVTSESSLPGVLPEEHLREALWFVTGDGLDVDAVFGATIAGATTTNSALTVSASGELEERYDKHRLIPFGERAPLADTWPALGKLTPAFGYQPGRDRPRRANRIKAATSICYEDTFAEIVRASANFAPTNVLVNLTNDAWFEGSSEPDVHLALARVRAVELRRSLVRSANLGRSVIIDPTGAVIAESLGPDEAGRVLDADGVLVADAPLLEASTVFQRIGEGPSWGGLGLALAFAFVRTPASLRVARRGSGVSPSAPS